MQHVHDIRTMRRERNKNSNAVIGLVPTMGFLHEGHLSLVEKARNECDRVVMSLFINPLQFGPDEDYDRYPRDWDRDVALAEKAGVDVLFAPDASEMFPETLLTNINVSSISDVLCGRSRPGHFDGVCTIVMKLLQIIDPDTVYFGQKDAQQVAVIHKMVKDLNVDTNVTTCPIIREGDGLAKSSRNVYLTDEERKQAVILYETLQNTRRKIENEHWRRTEAIRKEMIRSIERMPLAKVEYAEVLTYPELKPILTIEHQRILLALAVHFGKARLIDNEILEVEG